MSRLSTAVLLALGLAGLVRAETGLAFLTICPDAAAGAMGEVRSIGAGNAFDGIGNPALAPATDRIFLAVSRQEWLFDSRVHGLAAAWRRGRLGLGLDLRTLDVDDYELRQGPNPDPQGSFSQDDYALGLRASWELRPGLSVGAALRRVQEKLYIEDSQGWLGDLGLAWQGPAAVAGPLGWTRWQAGLALSHLGSMSEFVSESPEPPLTAVAGVGADGRLPGLGWTQQLRFELRQLQDDGSRFHLGFETVPVPGFAVRAGWMGGYSDKGLTAGAGFAWRDLRLDWAWLPFGGQLDQDVHRFTFSFAI